MLCYVPRRDEDLSSSALDTPHPTPLPHQAVAQLPIEGMVSLLPWDTRKESCDPTEGVDVGHILTQVYPLGAFKAGKLAVSGARKVAAVVRVIDQSQGHVCASWVHIYIPKMEDFNVFIFLV